VGSDGDGGGGLPRLKNREFTALALPNWSSAASFSLPPFSRKPRRKARRYLASRYLVPDLLN